MRHFLKRKAVKMRRGEVADVAQANCRERAIRTDQVGNDVVPFHFDDVMSPISGHVRFLPIRSSSQTSTTSIGRAQVLRLT